MFAGAALLTLIAGIVLELAVHRPLPELDREVTGRQQLVPKAIGAGGDRVTLHERCRKWL